MGKRKIIEIDRDKCNGCGLCTTACAEGALELDDENKAVLVKELYCDGMGACLDVCPVDALHIVEKDSDEYNAKAAFDHVKKTRGEDAAKNVHGAPHPRLSPLPLHDNTERNAQKENKEEKTMFQGCPGSMAQEFNPHPPTPSPKNTDNNNDGRGGAPSELSQWPIQLHLIMPTAPYFNECDLLIAADCTAFALGSFHQDLLKGKRLVIACPKLDETETYVDKLTELIKENKIFSLTVATMTVPCCSGLNHIVHEAVEKSGKDIAVKEVVIGLEGEIIS